MKTLKPLAIAACAVIVSTIQAYAGLRITTAPTTVVVVQGGTINFSVAATTDSGTPIHYQWYIDTGTQDGGGNWVFAPISGATNAIYSIPNAQQSTYDGYKVAVQVNDSFESIRSASVYSIVDVFPVIQLDALWQDTTVALGSTGHVLSANVVSGAVGSRLRCATKWTVDSGTTDIANQNNNSVVDIDTSKAGSFAYKFTASNYAGTAVATQIVNVVVAPTIKTQPVGGGVAVGSDFTFTVVATNTMGSYRWLFTDFGGNYTNLILQSTTNTYTVSGARTVHAGTYTVIMANVAGSVTSTPAILMVGNLATINSQPASTNIALGGTLNLTVGATGDSLQYQWRKGTNAISGATNATYSVSNVQTNANGNYSAIVSGVGSATSTVASVLVVPPPTISTQPSGKTVGSGSNYTMTVVAQGLLLNYQWYKSAGGTTNVVSGATTNTLTLSNVGSSDEATYSVTITNVGGSVTSSNVSIVIQTKPSITSQPPGTSTITNGSTNVTYSVGISGTSTSLQWKKGSTAIPNATTTNLTFSTVTTNDAGTYSLLVSNQVGTITSSNLVLRVADVPKITAQPVASKALMTGTNYTLSIAASGLDLSYQWYLGTNAVSNATTNSLALSSISTNAAGTYTVVVTNIAGSVTSSNAVISVFDRAVITTNLSNMTVTNGQDVTLAIGASGTSLAYQWKKGSTNYPGATSSSLALGTVTTNHAGTYSVIITNAVGSVTSSNLVLRVVDVPRITTQPIARKSLVVGSNYTLSVVASGLDLSYQWYLGTNAVANANTNTLALTAVTTNNEGTYTVVVTNIAGSVTSSNSVIDVLVKPSITTNLANMTVTNGQNVTLSIGATGDSLAYQWKRGTTNYPGATSATLALGTVMTNHAGTYFVVITNSVGSVTSSNLALRVVDVPRITTQPITNKALVTSSNYTLSVVASGLDLSYQWYLGTNAVNNGTSNSLTLTGVTTNSAGTYTVVVTNIAGSVTSSNSVITVLDKAVITTNLSNMTVTNGQDVTLSLGASGSSLTYQWKKGSTNYPGGTGSTLSLGTVTTNFAGTYSVIVSNSVGSVTSSNLVLKVVDVPRITTHPIASKAVVAGSNYTLSVVASGLDLSYQWYLGTNAVSNARTNSLTLRSVTTNEEGTYTVVVTNIAGSVTSSNSVINVLVKAAITTNLSNMTVTNGQDVTLSVGATGDSLVYRWKKGSTNYPGGTNATLALGTVMTNHAGTYSVIVSNMVGSVTSSNLVLRVVDVPRITTQPITNKAVVTGSNYTLSVVASGLDLSYQWYLGTNAVSNAKTNSLVLSGVTSNSAGTYTVVVTNIAGSVTSSNSVISVLDKAVITTNLSNLTVTNGQDVSLSIGASGTSLVYQWKKGSTNYPGATNSTLALGTLTTNFAGTYSVIVSNAVGSVTSSNLVLKVVDVPRITTQPIASKAVVAGSNYTLSVVASGLNLSYQWYLGTNAVSNATTNSLTLRRVTTNEEGTYTVVVTNIAGSVTSSNSVINVLVKPSITTNLSNMTVTNGQDVTLSIGASGDSLVYHWKKGSTNYPGGTNATLALGTVTTNFAGTYSVIVSNMVGSLTSSNLVLRVVDVPKITTQPITNKAVVTGSNYTLSVVASGLDLSYQWYLGTNAVSNARTNSLVLTGATTNSAGIYTVVVTNIAGSVTSSNSVISVLDKVAITTNLSNMTVTNGQDVTFSIGASGSSLMYQWKKGSTNYPGATNSTLALGTVTTNLAGTYSVIVSNLVGSVTSSNLVLKVVDVPKITTQPIASKAVVAGSNYTLSVVASGLNLSYQWYLGTNAVSNATTNSLTLRAVTTNNEGTYTVVITNIAGSVTSSNSVIDVLVKPSITTNLSNMTVTNGQDVTLSIGAAGDSLVYHWRKGSTNYPGATNSTLALGTVTTNFAGTYSVNVSNLVGTLTSSNLVLRVVDVPKITTQPIASKAVVTGSNYTLSVVASGLDLSYQWYLGTNAVSNARTNSLTISHATTNDAGTYTVVITNIAGSVTSSNSVISVLNKAAITTNLANMTVTNGQDVTLSIGASGDSLVYHWKKGSTNYPGATNSTLAFGPVTTNYAGTYSVVVSNLVNSVTSSNLVLRVVDVPKITTQPIASKAIVTGSNYTLSVVASGLDLSYQWYLGTNAVSNATTNSLTISHATTNNAGIYTVVVTNIAGTVTSSNSVISVLNKPAISTNLSSLTVTNGQDVTLTIGATGDSLAYQWKKGSTNYPGATNSTLALGTVTTNHAGTYSVVVTNAVGSATSSNLVLTVVAVPRITTQPLTNKYVAVGSNYTLSVVAQGLQLSYQWYLGTNAVSGGTSNSLVLNSLTTNNSGTYTVVITNIAGSVTSSNAVLSVLNKVMIMTNPISQTVTNGATVTLSVGARGDSLFYQWRQGTTAIPGATNSTYSIANIATNGSGTFSVVVSNAISSATSASAVVTVITWPPLSAAKSTGIDVGAGEYSGLFAASNGIPAFDSAGFASVSVTSDRRFSGKLLLAGDTISISGQFDQNGNASVSIPREGKADINLRMLLNIADKQLSGSVGSEKWSSVLTADRAVFSKANPTPNAGGCLLIIPAGDPRQTPLAQGSVLVNADGTVLFIGTAADGTALSESGQISKDGFWPFYTPVRNSSDPGAVIGWLRFGNSGPAGTLNWLKSSTSEVISTDVVVPPAK